MRAVVSLKGSGGISVTLFFLTININTMKRAISILSLPTIGLALLSLLVTGCGSDTNGNTSEPTNNVSNKESPKTMPIGQHLATEYFDVVVNGVKVSNTVNTGNEFSDLKQEEGNKYLIIDVTLKNTDNETRMMFDGEVVINQNGTNLKFEQAEPVMAEGYGMIMDNINPGITKKTKLVYKIPADAKGAMYYHPSRSDESALIELGTL